MLLNPYWFASAQLWTPADITTALWLDAADASTVTTVSGAVSEWRDKSGNSRHVSQSTAANRPALSAASFNENNAILFDGSNDFLQSTASITTGTYTGDFDVYWVGTRSGNGGTIITERVSARVVSSMWVFTGTIYTVSSDASSSASNHTISATTFNKVAGDGGVVAHFHTPGQRDLLYVNGTQETFNAGTANSVSGSTAYFRIGSREQFTGSPFNGRLCEIIVMLSSRSIRQQMEGYLHHKWGLAANLPSDHPYKNAPP